MKLIVKNMVAAVLVSSGLGAASLPAHAASVDLQSLLKDGLLGAGVGAISAGVGKGNAGTGALVGAGTQIIGSSLLSFLTTPSYGSHGQAVYAREQQVVAAQPVYYTQPQPVTYSQPAAVQPVTYAEPAYTYSQPAAPVYTYSTPQTAQDDPTKQILKQGLLGAGVGAISAGVGKGNAGTGALVGAGTQVIGGALLDFLSAPQTGTRTAAQPVYYSATRASSSYVSAPEPTQRRIVRSYDAEGRLVSEEEFWQ